MAYAPVFGLLRLRKLRANIQRNCDVADKANDIFGTKQKVARHRLTEFQYRPPRQPSP
jgi:hypothetical protein